ncbi:MAG: hypothetical protein V7677_10425 [Motiliproteus sp.]
MANFVYPSDQARADDKELDRVCSFAEELQRDIELLQLSFQQGKFYAYCDSNGMSFRVHRLLPGGNAQILIRTMPGGAEDCETVLLSSLRSGQVVAVV